MLTFSCKAVRELLFSLKQMHMSGYYISFGPFQDCKCLSWWKEALFKTVSRLPSFKYEKISCRYLSNRTLKLLEYKMETSLIIFEFKWSKNIINSKIVPSLNLNILLLLCFVCSEYLNKILDFETAIWM